jgi:hypothetical protein
MRHNIDTITSSKRIAAVVITTVAAILGLSASAASAAVYSVLGTQGRGLNVRTEPHLSTSILSNLPEGTAINIVCQTRGENVVASTMWDKIDQPVAGYVADYYTSTPNVNSPSPGLPSCEESSSNTNTSTNQNGNSNQTQSTTQTRHSNGGQQVYFTVAGQSCGPVTGAVTVSGANQYGDSATWTGSSSDGRSAFTRGWWWVGHVVVRFGRHVINGYVPPAHDQTDGSTPGQVTVTCSGTKYYPVWLRFNNLGGKVFLLINNDVAYDPLFHKYVSRWYTFGYWDGHYVYELNDHVGLDINDGELVIAESTDHWSILGGAIARGRVCLTGLSGAAGAPEIKAAIVAWCGVGGAVGAYIR